MSIGSSYMTRRSNRTLKRIGPTALAAVAAALGAAGLGAQTLGGGSLTLVSPFFAAGGGGGVLSGTTQSLSHSVGQTGNTAMAGGTLQLLPGVLGAQPLAQVNLDAAHAFPTPFKPSLGHDRITFRGLTPIAAIKIYTLSGELVKTLTKNDAIASDLVWYPVVNSAGETVASGVYFYVIEGDTNNQKSTGKLMIIR